MKQKPKNVSSRWPESRQGLEVIGAPGGFVALASYAALAQILLLDPVQRHAPQNAQVLSTIALAGAAFVFLKRHVQHPVTVVLLLQCPPGR
jgi:hypothetical protein